MFNIDENHIFEIYVVAVLIGAGGSTMLVTSLSVTADLIGNNSESGAFVYGFMSLTDKLSSGIAVIIIQNFIPEQNDNNNYFTDVLFGVCGGAALVSTIFMMTLVPFTIGQRWKDRPRNIISIQP